MSDDVRDRLAILEREASRAAAVLVERVAGLDLLPVLVTDAGR
jgi:hypothetical protein